MLRTVYEIKKSVEGKSRWTYFGDEPAVNGVGEVGKGLVALKRKYRVHHQFVPEGGAVNTSIQG